jgi:hypothetical protein
MKKIIAILAFIAIGLGADAQTGRGIYGTIQPFTAQPVSTYSVVAGIYIPVPAVDTYSVDTTAAQWTFNNNYDMLVDLGITKISGTVAGSAVLQGSIDGVTWYAITGNTTYCAACIGASATITNTAGTKHYQWYVPHSSVGFNKFQLLGVPTGTMSATFAATVKYKY